MSNAILTVDGAAKITEEIQYIESKKLPELKKLIKNAQKDGTDVKDLTEEYNFNRDRVPHLKNLLSTAKIVGEMKYFEITSPYYAMLKAPNREEAIEKYVEVVADDENGELKSGIKEVDRDYALVQFSRGTGEGLELLKPKELLEQFNENKTDVLLITSELA